MKKSELEKFFENNDFKVHKYIQSHKQCAEIERWTSGGVDMIINLNPFTKEEFISYVKDFDVDEQIMLHRQAKDYCKAFTIRQSLEDFEEFKALLETIVEKLNNL